MDVDGHGGRGHDHARPPRLSLSYRRAVRPPGSILLNAISSLGNSGIRKKSVHNANANANSSARCLESTPLPAPADGTGRRPAT